MFWIPWSTGCVFLRHDLQCGLLHLWVRKFMVLMVTGVTLPGRCGCLVGLLSPRCWRGWGFSGGKPGAGKGRG